MQSRLLVNRVNHVKRALGLVALVGFRLDPDGEELSSEIPGFDLVEIQIASAGVLREIEILIDEAAGGVGMGVNHKRRIVDGTRAMFDAVARNRYGLRT